MTTFSKVVCIDDAEFDVTFSATKPVPAVISGPPEHCHPAEGGEVEIEEVRLNNVELMPLLSEACMARIQEKLEEDIYELFEEEPYEPEDDDR